MILIRIQPTIIKYIELLQVQGNSPRRVHLLAMANSKNGLLASDELGASRRRVKLGALSLLTFFSLKHHFLAPYSSF